jgi:hypothetical protein
MTRTLLKRFTTRAALLTAAMTMAGCAANYSTANASTVLLIIADINAGTALKSDVLKGGAVFNDPVIMRLAVRFKNVNIGTTPQIPSAVIIERYEIAYRRSDGRGVEGQDVPFKISGNLTLGVDVTESSLTPLTVDFVRAQAKLEPPLRTLRGAATNTLGGALVVTMIADITLHGRTISGQPVTAKGSLQIDFADYGDDA